jgi:hypothetical protein
MNDNYEVDINLDDSFAEDDAHVSKRARKEEIQWTEQREFVLASLYYTKKAHIKTKMKMEDKKNMILLELKNHPAFEGLASKLTLGGITAKFGRMEKELLAKYSLDGEGSNLSGLPNALSKVNELVYKVAREKAEYDLTTKARKQKEGDRNERIQKNQTRMLQNMVKKSVLIDC